MQRHITLFILSCCYFVSALHAEFPTGGGSQNEAKIFHPSIRIKTLSIREITYQSATVFGKVGGRTTDGLKRGICYSKDPSAPLDQWKRVYAKGAGSGLFHVKLSKLNPETTYYIRPFVRGPKQIEYGTQSEFNTPTGELPSLATLESRYVFTDRATVSANVYSDGGYEVYERGFIWTAFPKQPAQLWNKLVDTVAGSGPFALTIYDLEAFNEYYVCSYAINSKGIQYGNINSFMTQNGFPVAVQTEPADNITSESAVLKGELKEYGMSDVVRGFYWSTSDSLDIDEWTRVWVAGVIREDDSTDSKFSLALKDLMPNTTYYYRSFAVNYKEYKHGDICSFKTLPVASQNEGDKKSKKSEAKRE